MVELPGGCRAWRVFVPNRIGEVWTRLGDDDVCMGEWDCDT